MAEDGFRGIVIDDGKLFLRAYDKHNSGSQQTTVVTSVPLSRESADQIARGLGKVEFLPSFFQVEESAVPGSKEARAKPNFAQSELSSSTVVGGKVPVKEYFYDIPIQYGAGMVISEWKTGRPHNILVAVNSEPSLLYHRLVIASLQSQSFFQNALIGLAIFFLVLELIAFYMAVRLSRTITQSVHDLYEATGEVDRGNFSHRIPVRRNDQLAALSRFLQLHDLIARGSGWRSSARRSACKTNWILPRRFRQIFFRVMVSHYRCWNCTASAGLLAL